MQNAARASRFVAVAFTAVTFAGCTSRDSLTVWRETFPSPDGSWLATAMTIQNGGFGSAKIDTIVEVKSSTGSRGQVVLDLDCDGPLKQPYTLDNDANRGGSVGLEVRWISATQLFIRYRNYPRVQAYVPKLSAVSIAIAEIS